MDPQRLAEIEARVNASIKERAGYGTQDHLDIANLCTALREAWAELDEAEEVLAWAVEQAYAAGEKARKDCGR